MSSNHRGSWLIISCFDIHIQRADIHVNRTKTGIIAYHNRATNNSLKSLVYMLRPSVVKSTQIVAGLQSSIADITEGFWNQVLRCTQLLGSRVNK